MAQKSCQPSLFHEHGDEFRITAQVVQNPLIASNFSNPPSPVTLALKISAIPRQQFFL